MSYLDNHYRHLAPYGFGIASQGPGHHIRHEASTGWVLTGVAQVQAEPRSQRPSAVHAYPGFIMSGHYRCVTTSSAHVGYAQISF